MLQKVQRDSLSGQQHLSFADDAREDFVSLNRFAVRRSGFDLQIRIEVHEHCVGDFQSGQNDVLFGHEISASLLACFHDRARSDVSASQIFGQRTGGDVVNDGEVLWVDHCC